MLLDYEPCKNKHRCLNGGKCIKTKNSFECACLGGYTGDRCEGNVEMPHHFTLMNHCTFTLQFILFNLLSWHT